MADAGLRGPLGERALHLCVDMQNVFAEETPWHTPWMRRIAPLVAAIVDRHPDQTIFTRFMPPQEPDGMPGTWRAYFHRWQELTRSKADPWLFEIIDPLRRYVPPASVLDKPFYSPFHATLLAQTLRDFRCDTLVISGAETDVCVLAAVLDAVDLGLRVVLPTDAICGSSDETHDALLKLYRERFSIQIETVDTATLLAAWD